MNLAVRRRLAVGALACSSALVAGFLLAPAGNAAANGLSISPAGAANTDNAATLTFHSTDADTEFGGTATFSRVGGGQPFDVTIPADQPPTGKDTSHATTHDFTDEGDGLGVDGPADAGTYNVSLTGTAAPVPTPLAPGGGTDTCSSCFTVLPAGPVAVDSASPSSIRPGDTADDLKIGGDAFERGSKVEFLFDNGAVDPLITVSGPLDSTGKAIVDQISTRKQLQRQVKVGLSDAPGTRSVRVTNLDGNTATCTGCFFVAGAALSGISPTSAYNESVQSITINGTNLATNGQAQLEFTGDPGSASRSDLAIPGTTTSPSNGSTMTASFDLTNAAPGNYQMVVRGDNGVVNACEQPQCPLFTVLQRNEPPTVVGLDSDPSTAGNQSSQPAGSTQVFTVSGTNFSKGVQILPSGTGVTVTAVEFVSPTEVKATFATASDATTGAQDVTAKLTDGSTSTACKGCYTVTAANASPSPSASASATPSPSGTPCPTPASASPSASPTASSGGGLPLPIGGSSSPSASASASPTAAASATASPTASATGLPLALNAAAASGSSACPQLTIAVDPANIVPNQTSAVTVTGQPSTPVELYAYTQPNTTYGLVRSGTTDANGTITWNVMPGRNTRLYAHYARSGTTTASDDSRSTVIIVHTSLSLSAYRDGVRKYHFQGTNLPRRSGQLITLYRYATGPNLDQYCVPTPESDTTVKSDGTCKAIITSQVKTGPDNTWRIDRTFTGSGRFYFVVRTGQTMENGRGHSNQRDTVIH